MPNEYQMIPNDRTCRVASDIKRMMFILWSYELVCMLLLLQGGEKALLANKGSAQFPLAKVEVDFIIFVIVGPLLLVLLTLYLHMLIEACSNCKSSTPGEKLGCLFNRNSFSTQLAFIIVFFLTTPVILSMFTYSVRVNNFAFKINFWLLFGCLLFLIFQLLRLKHELSPWITYPAIGIMLVAPYYAFFFSFKPNPTPPYYDYPLNVSGADLAGIDFNQKDYFRRAQAAKANFAAAVFWQADLTGLHAPRANFKDANLFGACLECADLGSANLTGAMLSKANLRKAKLANTDFTEAKLVEADFSDSAGEDKETSGSTDCTASKDEPWAVTADSAIFLRANLQKAKLNRLFVRCLFAGTDFRGADFNNAKLEDAILFTVKLEDTPLAKCSFKRCLFLNTDFEKTDFSGTQLEEAIFARAKSVQPSQKNQATDHCEKANFHLAKLKGAIFYNDDLHNTNFSGAQLEGVIFAKTRLRNDTPENAKPDSESARFENAQLDNVIFLDSPEITSKILSKAARPENACVCGEDPKMDKTLHKCSPDQCTEATRKVKDAALIVEDAESRIKALTRDEHQQTAWNDEENTPAH